MPAPKCDQRDFSISRHHPHHRLLWRDGFDRRLLTGPVSAGIADLQLGRRSQTVDRVIEAQMDYFRDRLGATAKPTLPELPVIRVGVDCDGFKQDGRGTQELARASAHRRSATWCCCSWAASFHAKAHPLPDVHGGRGGGESDQGQRCI